MRAKDFIKKNTISLSNLLKSKEFLDRIEEPFVINTSYDVPYVAGCSDDRKTVYFDRDLPEKINGINIIKYISFHEKVESTLMDMYELKYQVAHSIATMFEKNLVVSDGLDWDAYCKIVDPYIKKMDKKKLQHCPRDLDLQPYVDEMDIAKMISGVNDES